MKGCGNKLVNTITIKLLNVLLNFTHMLPVRMIPIDFQGQGNKEPIRQVENSLNEVANVCRKIAIDRG